MKQPTPDKSLLEAQLRRWLTDESYAVLEIDVVPDGADWAFITNFSPISGPEEKTRLKVAIAGYERLERIRISVNFTTNPGQQEKSKGSRSRVDRNLAPYALQVGLEGFSLSQNWDKDGKLLSFQIETSIYRDAPLTRHLFLGTLRKTFSVGSNAANNVGQSLGP